MPEPLPVAIADTSALIAFFNAADGHHKSVRSGFSQVGHIVVSPCVLTEFDYLVASKTGPDPARAALGYIDGRVATGRWEAFAWGEEPGSFGINDLSLDGGRMR